MAETTQTQATGDQSQVSDNTPPWKRMWNSAAETVTSAINSLTGNDDDNEGKQPWEMNFSKDVQLVNQARASSMQQASNSDAYFNQVFNKLKGAESGNRHTDANGNLITSSAGARGVTQVIRKTGADPGYGVQPLQNQSRSEYERFGRDYLQAMLKNFKGDYEKAVAAYNAGPGSVQDAVAKAKAKGGSWTDHLPKASETIPYMNKILGTNYSIKEK